MKIFAAKCDGNEMPVKDLKELDVSLCSTSNFKRWKVIVIKVMLIRIKYQLLCRARGLKIFTTDKFDSAEERAIASTS